MEEARVHSRLRSKFGFFIVALGLATLWLLMHGYHGLTGDGQIYALQAFARLHPQLATDLYLSNTSQDRYTLFSPFYAWWIELLGLENAARLLTLLFTGWLLAAVWSVTRAVAGRETAWVSVAFVLSAAGYYGGSGVFRILDPFLTARLPAEALVVTALACQTSGKQWFAFAAALGALLVHPLIALPGILLIICLWLSPNIGRIGALAGVLATLGLTIVATRVPTIQRILPIMDSQWLSIVQERSQFLFLQLWSLQDWTNNLQPFLCLGFTAIVVPNARTRRLCGAATLVGAAGLAVAAIGDLIGPLAILVQGQAWRWVWITVLVSEALVPITVLDLSNDGRCGPLCALLLVCGCALSGIEGPACVVLALALWLGRHRLNPRAVSYLRLASTGLGVTIGMWLLIKCMAIIGSPAEASSLSSTAAGKLQQLFALKAPAMLLIALVWRGLRATQATRVLLAALLTMLSTIAAPIAFRQPRLLASLPDVHEFSDWTRAIPPTSTVFVARPRDVGAFVWFTLNRPNYLSLDQSAGVVFSRITALEVERRSKVLLPIQDPEWKILTRLRTRPGSAQGSHPVTRRLTRENLIQICGDPQLGFVISPEKVGFSPLTHESTGGWEGWNLYDCSKVRASARFTQE
jgi:hypothetical protein